MNFNLFISITSMNFLPDSVVLPMLSKSSLLAGESHLFRLDRVSLTSAYSGLGGGGTRLPNEWTLLTLIKKESFSFF